MLRTLPFYVPWLAILLPLLVGRSLAQTALSWPNAEHIQPAARLVVLRNGEVLQGRVVTTGQRVVVAQPGREISLRQSEVDVIARTLEEAYLSKRSKVRPTDVDARLDLADWCLRHNVLAGARVELSATGQVQPFNPRQLALERRLQQALVNDINDMTAHRAGYSWPPVAAAPSSAKETETKSAEPARPRAVRGLAAAESPAALERFVRSLPGGAVEQFTGGLHPMITRGCATAGCHAPGNTTEFTLLRLPHGRAPSRRLTQRNLYNTVQLVDFANPEESRLLKIASQPHGPLPSGVFGDARSPKYQELVAWVAGLTGMPMNRNEGSNDSVIANVGWDREDNAGEQPPLLAQPEHVQSAADELQPNRPAEVKGP